ncbi:uncharacterized protein [Primulina eburnea]|uniref:uncharacterized protein n=1 Tax=Primulina eburnea TaxID=1245227 RepID=UPI003C6C98B5
MEEKILDYVLMPLELIVMVAYHIWLLREIINRPTTTVIGVNAIYRRVWVQAMMEDPSKNGILAVQTLRNNIMASTLLASTAIMLSSLITVLMTGSSAYNPAATRVVYGDRGEPEFTLKFSSILVCFLVAFLLNVQSIRYYSHAGILINVRMSRNIDNNNCSDCATAEYVGCFVNRGSYFWSLGLRAFYFSFPLFLWILGSIPMFLCCVVLVFLLYFLDVTFGLGCVVSAAPKEEIACVDESSNFHNM